MICVAQTWLNLINIIMLSDTEKKQHLAFLHETHTAVHIFWYDISIRLQLITRWSATKAKDRG